MLWPLIYRHTTLQGWTEAATDRFGHFVQSLESSEHDLSPRSTWIQSLWIHQNLEIYPREDHRADYSTSNHVPILREMIRKTLPHMVHMREFCCYVPLSVRELEVLEKHGFDTITTFATSCRGPDMTRMVSLLHRLVKLRDLRIEFEPVTYIKWPKDDLPFPELQLLEICGQECKVMPVLDCLKDSSMPKLHTLRLTVSDCSETLSNANRSILASFMEMNGSNLVTFECGDGDWYHAMEVVFRHTPQLKHLELGHRLCLGLDSFISYLPTSVVSITHKLPSWRNEHDLKGIQSAAGGLPIGSQVSTFIVAATSPRLTYSFKKVLEKGYRGFYHESDRSYDARIDRWMGLVNSLTPYQIRVLDEEGDELEATITAKFPTIRQVSRLCRCE
jgi:hypothetical protein